MFVCIVAIEQEALTCCWSFYFLIGLLRALHHLFAVPVPLAPTELYQYCSTGLPVPFKEY